MSAPDPKEPCFIDTNVWLYAFIQSQDQNKSAIAKTIIQQSEIIVSAQVINEVCVNLIKKAHFDEPRIQQLIHSFYHKYSVAALEEAVLLTASDLRQKWQLSFWDSVIVSSALSGGATILYSEDMHSGLVIENRLRIINPF
ncbi:MAG TPA: PIN domain-containing protein [Blastocatellia bacterium]|nr:PIN domain-containing protein [Blastocatellia bacterium]